MDIMDTLKLFNEKQAAVGKIQIKIGIGIAVGVAIAGYTTGTHNTVSPTLALAIQSISPLAWITKSLAMTESKPRDIQNKRFSNGKQKISSARQYRPKIMMGWAKKI